MDSSPRKAAKRHLKEEKDWPSDDQCLGSSSPILARKSRRTANGVSERRAERSLTRSVSKECQNSDNIPRVSTATKRPQHEAVCNVTLEDIRVDLGNKSWAELVEESFSSKSDEPTTTPPKRGGRKQASPKKCSTKAKFERSSPVEPSRPSRARSTSRSGADERSRSRPRVTAVRRSPRKHVSSGVEPRLPLSDARRRIASPPRKPSSPPKAASTPTTADAARTFPKRTPQLPARYPQRDRNDWTDPKLGWCEDVAKLSMRQKHIQKAKDSLVYRSYRKAVPKEKRVGGIHPRTPNKLINYSRRSWDMQVRMWKRELHVWNGDAISLSDISHVESFSSNASNADCDDSFDPTELDEESARPAQSQDPDRLASLLGYYDVDSQKPFKKDEDTLQAANDDADTLLTFMKDPAGPVDFSLMDA